MKARDNPFSSHHLERLPFMFRGEDSWTSLLERLAAQGNVGSIVGPPGSGKSLLLDQMVPHLEMAGYVPVRIRLTSGSSMREKEKLSGILRCLTPPEFVILDGAEQLSTRQWLPVRAAAAHAAGLIITGHRVGRLPTFAVCETNAALLEELVFKLTGGGLPPGVGADLLWRHFGNVRECLRELYDRWAGDEVAQVEELGEVNGHATEAGEGMRVAEEQAELFAPREEEKV